MWNYSLCNFLSPPSHNACFSRYNERLFEFHLTLIFCCTDDVAGVGVSMLTMLHHTSVCPGTEGRAFYRTEKSRWQWVPHTSEWRTWALRAWICVYLWVCSCNIFWNNVVNTVYVNNPNIYFIYTLYSFDIHKGCNVEMVLPSVTFRVVKLWRPGISRLSVPKGRDKPWNKGKIFVFLQSTLSWLKHNFHIFCKCC